MTPARHQFASRIQVLVAHLQASSFINFGDQAAEDDGAAAILSPDQSVLLMLMKDRLIADFAICRIGYRNEPAVVIIDLCHSRSTDLTSSSRNVS